MEVKTESLFQTLETKEDKNDLQAQHIKDIIKKKRYVTYKVTTKTLTPDGRNYFGILSEVKIQGETVKGKKETNIFMKTIASDVRMTMISLTEAYKNELFVYKELSHVYKELQDEVRLSANEAYTFVKSYNESNPTVIILENMTPKGFKTIFRMDVITLQYAKMAIKELAKFHALSFVLESKRPNYFDRKIKTMDITFSFDKDWDDFVENMCRITLNYLDQDSRRKLEDFVPSFNKKYRKYLEGNNRRLCLRHGDYRPSNILLKETNGEYTKMIPIDYQFLCYGSPIMDFIYFIFPSTDQQFRRSHLPYLKNFYYECLESSLVNFSLDVEIIYPRVDFEDDYKDMLDYGLMIAILLVPLLMVNNDDIPDIMKEPMAGLNLSVVDQCRDRLVGVVQDFIEWGYL